MINMLQGFRHLITLISIFFVTSTLGQAVDNVILPISLSELADSNVKHDVSSILAKSKSIDLIEYKAMRTRTTAIDTHSNYRYVFMQHQELDNKYFVHLIYDDTISTNSQYLNKEDYYVGLRFNKIVFSQYKFRSAVSRDLISTINNAYLSKISKQATYRAQAYNTKNNLWNYLYIEFSSKNVTVSFVFVADKYGISQCVVKEDVKN